MGRNQESIETHRGESFDRYENGSKVTQSTYQHNLASNRCIQVFGHLRGKRKRDCEPYTQGMVTNAYLSTSLRDIQIDILFYVDIAADM